MAEEGRAARGMIIGKYLHFRFDGLIFGRDISHWPETSS